jgi:hypothetical protein
VSETYKEIKAGLKLAEMKVNESLNTNFNEIECQFKIIRDIPKKQYEETEKWKKLAQ